MKGNDDIGYLSDAAQSNLESFNMERSCSRVGCANKETFRVESLNRCLESNGHVPLCSHECMARMIADGDDGASRALWEPPRTDRWGMPWPHLQRSNRGQRTVR